MFDVVVDGKKLYSKHDSDDEFPRYQEIPNLILMEGLGE